MNPAIMIVIHAAHAAAKSREKCLDTFRVQAATAPERARPLAELGLPNDDKSFAALVAAGIIKGVDSRGRPTVIGDAVSRTVAFYLDEPELVAQRDLKTSKSRRGAIIVGIVVWAVLILLIGLLVALRSQG